MTSFKEPIELGVQVFKIDIKGDSNNGTSKLNRQMFKNFENPQVQKKQTSSQKQLKNDLNYTIQPKLPYSTSTHEQNLTPQSIKSEQQKQKKPLVPLKGIGGKKLIKSPLHQNIKPGQYTTQLITIQDYLSTNLEKKDSQQNIMCQENLQIKSNLPESSKHQALPLKKPPRRNSSLGHSNPIQTEIQRISSKDLQVSANVINFSKTPENFAMIHKALSPSIEKNIKQEELGFPPDLARKKQDSLKNPNQQKPPQPKNNKIPKSIQQTQGIQDASTQRQNTNLSEITEEKTSMNFQENDQSMAQKVSEDEDMEQLSNLDEETIEIQKQKQIQAKKIFEQQEKKLQQILEKEKKLKEIDMMKKNPVPTIIKKKVSPPNSNRNEKTTKEKLKGEKEERKKKFGKQDLHRSREEEQEDVIKEEIIVDQQQLLSNALDQVLSESTFQGYNQPIEENISGIGVLGGFSITEYVKYKQNESEVGVKNGGEQQQQVNKQQENQQKRKQSSSDDDW